MVVVGEKKRKKETAPGKKLSAIMRVEQPGRSLEEQPDEDTRHTVRSGFRRDEVWDKT